MQSTQISDAPAYLTYNNTYRDFHFTATSEKFSAPIHFADQLVATWLFLGILSENKKNVLDVENSGIIPLNFLHNFESTL